MIAPAIDRIGEIGFPGNRGNIELLEIFARRFFYFLSAFEELLHGDGNPCFAWGMRVEGRHEPWHPADPTLEEAKTQRGEPIQSPAENQARRADHVSQRKTERRGKMLKTLEAFRADEPGVAVL